MHAAPRPPEPSSKILVKRRTALPYLAGCTTAIALSSRSSITRAAFGGQEDSAQRFAFGRVSSSLQLQQFGVARHNVKQLVEVVGNAAFQLPERSHVRADSHRSEHLRRFSSGASVSATAPLLPPGNGAVCLDGRSKEQGIQIREQGGTISCSGTGNPLSGEMSAPSQSHDREKDSARCAADRLSANLRSVSRSVLHRIARPDQPA